MGQSNTTTRIVIAVCVTAAAGLALFYYYFKQEMERSREKIESREGMPKKRQEGSVEREKPPPRGRLKAHRRVQSPGETSDLVTAISSEVGDSSVSTARSDKFSGSMKLKRSPSRKSMSTVSSMTSSTSGTAVGSSSVSTARSVTSNSYRSSENYPAAIAREQKGPPVFGAKPQELPAIPDERLFGPEPGSAHVAEKLEKAEKSRSGESVGATKLLPAEDSPSPREIIPIDSYCYCGQESASATSSITGELNDSCKVELLPTIVKPVSFDPYSPEDLTQVEGSSEELSQNSIRHDPLPKNHYIIIPFLPILHAITYASKHAQLLQELMQNYEYYESQALESV